MVIFTGQEGAGAADTGLYFVHKQQNVPRGAELSHFMHIIRFKCNDPAFALHKLHHDGAGAAIPGRGGQRVEVAGRHIDEIFGEGAEIVVEGILPGCGQGGKRPAVEGILQRDNPAAALAVVVNAVFACKLDRALVRFGPRIAEKYLVEPGAGTKPLGQPAAGGGIVEV